MRLYFHILRAHAGPFAFALITVMFIFLLQFIMKFIDQLVGKGLSMWVIGELMTLSLAWMVVLAVPMAVLVSSLMGFGTLSSHNEITAMKASGMSLYRMIAPVAIAALLLTYGMVIFNNDILPEANHRVKVLMVDIRRQKPTLTIVPGLFSQDISGYSILARKTFEHSNDLEGVTIFDYTDPSTNVVVTATRGTVSFTPDYRKLILDLYNGEIHRLGIQNMQEYRKLHYERHRIVMNAEGFDFERSNENAFSRGDRELSAQAMQHLVDSLELINAQAQEEVLRRTSTVEVPWRMMHAPLVRSPKGLPVQQDAVSRRREAITVALNRVRSTMNSIDNQTTMIRYNQDQINQYVVEINKKFSIPVACFVFVFIGAPLGIMARRGSFGVAASLSVGFFLLYWASLIGGEKLADRVLISPWIGMWIADIFLGLLGAYLTFRMAKETPTINWLTLRRFIPRYLRVTE